MEPERKETETMAMPESYANLAVMKTAKYLVDTANCAEMFDLAAEITKYLSPELSAAYAAHEGIEAKLDEAKNNAQKSIQNSTETIQAKKAEIESLNREKAALKQELQGVCEQLNEIFYELHPLDSGDITTIFKVLKKNLFANQKKREEIRNEIKSREDILEKRRDEIKSEINNYDQRIASAEIEIKRCENIIEKETRILNALLGNGSNEPFVMTEKMKEFNLKTGIKLNTPQKISAFYEMWRQFTLYSDVWTLFSEIHTAICKDIDSGAVEAENGEHTAIYRYKLTRSYTVSSEEELSNALLAYNDFRIFETNVLISYVDPMIGFYAFENPISLYLVNEYFYEIAEYFPKLIGFTNKRKVWDSFKERINSGNSEVFYRFGKDNDMHIGLGLVIDHWKEMILQKLQENCELFNIKISDIYVDLPNKNVDIDKDKLYKDYERFGLPIDLSLSLPSAHLCVEYSYDPKTVKM